MRLICFLRLFCNLRLFCKKTAELYVSLTEGKTDINSLRGLNDKRTTPDSSVYLLDNVKKAGLRATSRLVARHTQKNGLIFYFGLSAFRQIKPFSYDI